MRRRFWSLIIAGYLILPAFAHAGEVKVLKFSGPVTDADRESLERAGVRILEAAPPNGYLVEVPETAELPRGSRLLPWQMTGRMSAELIDLVAGRVRTEVSGGINEETLRDYAEAGPDAISMGALTHSVSASDIAFDLTPLPA